LRKIGKPRKKNIISKKIDELEKSNNELYTQYYNEKVKIEIDIFSKMIDEINKCGDIKLFYNFINKNIIERNIDVRIIQLDSRKHKYYIDFETLYAIKFFSCNINNFISVVIKKKDNDIFTFFTILKFCNGYKVKIENTLRSDHPLKKGHKLNQINNKYNIISIHVYERKSLCGKLGQLIWSIIKLTKKF
jgi:hypothetical protein